MKTGTVKRYSPSKGYGFIKCDGGPDVFVHASTLGAHVPIEGARVNFELVPSTKRTGQVCATNVEPVR
jgi:cold shock protein